MEPSVLQSVPVLVLTLLLAGRWAVFRLHVLCKLLELQSRCNMPGRLGYVESGHKWLVLSSTTSIPAFPFDRG